MNVQTQEMPKARVLTHREALAARANSATRLLEGFHTEFGVFRPLEILEKMEAVSAFYTGTDFALIRETLDSFANNGEFILADDVRDDLTALLTNIRNADSTMRQFSLTMQWEMAKGWVESANSCADGSQSPLGLLRNIARRIEMVRDTAAWVAERIG